MCTNGGMVSMKRIPNIALTGETVKQITTTSQFNKGGEAIICLSDRPDTLYKIFINPSTGEIIEMSDNKLKKITSLFEMNPEYSVKPLSTITMDGRLIGYEMTYNRESRPLSVAKLDRTSTIEVLKRTKVALEHFASYDIVYGDIASRNILIDRNRQIEFCDMDNVQIKDLPIDLQGKDLRRFTRAYGKTDEKADAYMHNLFTLQQLKYPTQNPTYEDIITALSEGPYPSNFKRGAIRVFDSMLDPKKFTGEYAVKYLKR